LSGIFTRNALMTVDVNVKLTHRTLASLKLSTKISGLFLQFDQPGLRGLGRRGGGAGSADGDAAAAAAAEEGLLCSIRARSTRVPRRSTRITPSRRVTVIMSHPQLGQRSTAPMSRA
jgi:hypothetical protein